MPTTQQAVDAAFGIFSEAWADLAYPVMWPGKSNDVVDIALIKTPWVFAKIRHGDGRLITAGGFDGTGIWQRRAQVIFEVYALSGGGTDQAYILARLIEMAFVRKNRDGVNFRGIRIQEEGTQGNWFLVNVTVDFEYDEVV